MTYIEDIQKKASEMLRKMGLDWLENRLRSDTVFKITSIADNAELETTLNYMVWRGWVDGVPVLTNDDGISSGWRLTREGQSLAMSSIHGTKPQPTPEPSKGRSCPY